MIDRDKVIRALEYLISEDCTDNQFDYADEIETAIALLKEQEAREKNRLPYSPDSNVQWT